MARTLSRPLHGGTGIEITISDRNDGSLRFHDRYGFVSVGEQDTDAGAKRVTMLEKRLDG